MTKQDYTKIANLLLHGAKYEFGISLPKMDTPRNGREEIWQGIYAAMKEMGVDTDLIGDQTVSSEMRTKLDELKERFGNGLTMQGGKGKAYFLYQGVWQRDTYGRIGVCPVMSLDMMRMLEWTPTNINIKKNPKKAVAIWKRAMDAHTFDCRSRKEARRLLTERARALGMELTESDTHFKIYDQVTGEAEIYDADSFDFIEYIEPEL